MARDVEEEDGLKDGAEFLAQLRAYADEQVERYRDSIHRRPENIGTRGRTANRD